MARFVDVLATIFLVPVGTFVLWSIWSFVASPIKSYPGPFLAKWSNLWRLYHISRGSFHKVLERLHQKYGPVVRIGPNVLDLDVPDMVKSVFNTKGDWLKTEYYHGSSALVNGQIVYNLFSQTDPAKHAQEKKPIAKFYSINSILQFEPHMDKIITQFLRELDVRFVNLDKPVDLGAWINYYTWDVVGAVTFSQPLGYLQHGKDFDGTLGNAERALDYFSAVGAIPFLDRVLDKNPVYRIGPPGFGNITGIAVQRMIARFQGADADTHDPANPDFLDRFIEAKTQNPDTVDDGQIIAWLMINMIAGADTTAITIRSALYYLLKNPRALKRLRADLEAANIKGSSPAAYKDCRAIPYLDAVVREALRMLPGVSLSLERYVPAGGCTIPASNGKQGGGGFVPAGTILGFNPYLICRNPSIWGFDANAFRPERWLKADGESEDAFAKRLRTMNDADLSFGGGSRICIGKSMGLTQVYKVVATLVTRYDIELLHPEREWKVINSWFPRQEGLVVRMTPANEPN